MRCKQWSCLFIMAFCFAVFVPGSSADAGAIVEYGGMKAYIPSGDGDKPNDEQKKEIIDFAEDYQKSGGVYKADSFGVELVKKGRVLYAMLPGQGNFYTDEATIRLTRSSEELNNLLQINFYKGTLRRGLAKYVVQVDMYVAAGICRNNMQFGVGGGKQYLLPVLVKQQSLFEDRRPIASSWEDVPAA